MSTCNYRYSWGDLIHLCCHFFLSNLLFFNFLSFFPALAQKVEAAIFDFPTSLSDFYGNTVNLKFGQQIRGLEQSE